ncbi:MAG: hypothetical protein HFG83_09015, partial [Dorea sp.]|nr:hypothetical protein [Dorea sp.]
EKAFVKEILEINGQYRKDCCYIRHKGENARKLLEREYTTQNAFDIIVQAYNKHERINAYGINKKGKAFNN